MSLFGILQIACIQILPLAGPSRPTSNTGKIQTPLAPFMLESLKILIVCVGGCEGQSCAFAGQAAATMAAAEQAASSAGVDIPLRKFMVFPRPIITLRIIGM